MKRAVLASIGVLVVASIGVASHVSGSNQRAARVNASRTAAVTTANWTTYHHDNSRAGYDAGEPTFTVLNPAWTQSTLTGQIYASPLVYGGTVYVGTEDNYIYALDANNSGTVLWSIQLSAPELSSNLPCGNISPNVGITSTPVIDTTTNRIFAVGNVSTHHYVLWGVNLTTHAIDVNVVVDPSSSLDVVHAQGQRGALAVSQGVVYIPYGGRAGDCNSPLGQPYHGVVIGARATDGALLYNFTTNGGRKGIWAPGGESVDASGNVYVATGNGYGGTPNDSETTFMLSPSLGVVNRWVPANQAALDAADADTGSIIPTLVGGGDILQSGKSGDSYLLNSTLGQVQGPTHVCTGLSSDASFGAAAYLAPYIYVPCTNGLFAVTQSGNTFAAQWSFPGVNATSPIIAGGAVLVLDGGGSTLRALNPTTGVQITSVSTGSLTHFAAPATGDGMVFVPGVNEIDAFSMGGCSSANMSPGVASPQATGATVTFTATATGCATPEFKFFLQPPGASWTAQTAFGANTWAWNTTGLAPGIYGVGVWARQSGSGAAYESYWLGTYTLTGSCSVVSITPSVAPPQAPGTAVTFTASAGGCPAAVFKWLALIPGRSGWVVIQDYPATGTGNTYSWAAGATSGSPQGIYQIGVWAKQTGSTNSYDAYTITTYTLLASCANAALSASPASPQASGTVTVTATAAGCAGTLFEFWELAPGAGWVSQGAFSTTNTLSFNATAAARGQYRFGVWVKDPNSINTYDSYAIITFYVGS